MFTCGGTETTPVLGFQGKRQSLGALTAHTHIELLRVTVTANAPRQSAHSPQAPWVVQAPARQAKKKPSMTHSRQPQMQSARRKEFVPARRVEGC